MHPSTNQARVSPFHLRVSSSAAARKISRKVLLLSQKRREREKNALKISSSARIHTSPSRARTKNVPKRARVLSNVFLSSRIYEQKEKPTRASKTVPSFIRDSGRHVCNDLISRVFRRVRVFLLCAFERQKNSLVSAEKEQLKKKNKKFRSFVFSSIFFQTLSPPKK